MQLESLLERSAAAAPDKTFLICGERRPSYAQIDAEANRLAHLLIELGVGRGDRVAIQLDNGIEAVVAIFAALKAGAVFLMVNPTTKSDKLTYILNNSRATALIGFGRKLRSLSEIWPHTPSLKVVIGAGGAASDTADSRKRFARFEQMPTGDCATAPAKRCINIDLAALIYTSGSTGNPKGVMLTHLNMTSAATSITTYLGMRSDDVVINVLPISFDYGLYQVLMTALVGGTLVLEKSFAFPRAILDVMVRERVTGFPIVPTMAAILLQTDLTGHDLGSLRFLTNTAAALPTEHIQRLRGLFPQARLFSMYGLTECKRVSYLPPEQLDVRPDSVGRGMPNEEVYVVDDDGRRVGPNVVGELVVRGANVMKGYWELPEATAERLKPGPLPGESVLYTGDLFRTDAEGYLYFVGRKDDIIKCRGEKVSPKEVENVLHAHPDVIEAAVVGVSHAVLGQAVRAVVAVRQDATCTERDLLRHCAKYLEDFMVPEGIELRTDLPKTGNGKINKRLLAGTESVSPTIATFAPPANNGGVGSVGNVVTAAETLAERLLGLDAEAEIVRIARGLREQVGSFKRKGLVLGLSGGVDSSVCAGLCVRAVGANRVLGILMPENDSDPESERLGRAVAETFGIEVLREDIAGTLEAAGCYRRREEALRSVIPEFAAGDRFKIVLPSLDGENPYRLFSAVARLADGREIRARLPLEAYQTIVAATNFKQRVRKMLEYYHADRLRYAVVGTPNLLEYDQGFFVKNGDGSADVKPIAHLYKTQVYELAEALGVPEEIRDRPPTTDTYSLAQSQEEFFFSVPYTVLDLCVAAMKAGLLAEEVAEAAGLTVEQAARVYRDIRSKRAVAAYLHATPQLMSE